MQNPCMLANESYVLAVMREDRIDISCIQCLLAAAVNECLNAKLISASDSQATAIQIQ